MFQANDLQCVVLTVVDVNEVALMMRAVDIRRGNKSMVVWRPLLSDVVNGRKLLIIPSTYVIVATRVNNGSRVGGKKSQ